MNVLIIPEDFRLDQFILKPIIKAMMTELGKPRANVRVCREPLLGGVEQAMKWERIAEILDMNRTVDLFLLIVDRDGKEGRRRGLDALEQQTVGELSSNRCFIAENAWQEIEVWLLAGHRDLPKEWQWKEIREERDPKELYFKILSLMPHNAVYCTRLGEDAKDLGAKQPNDILVFVNCALK